MSALLFLPRKKGKTCKLYTLCVSKLFALNWKYCALSRHMMPIVSFLMAKKYCDLAETSSENHMVVTYKM